MSISMTIFDMQL